MAKQLRPEQIELLDTEVVVALRELTPAQRLALGLECNRTARLRLQTHFQQLHPDWSKDEILAAVARRMLHGAD
jgi:hypothetical protein